MKKKFIEKKLDKRKHSIFSLLILFLSPRKIWNLVTKKNKYARYTTNMDDHYHGSVDDFW